MMNLAKRIILWMAKRNKAGMKMVSFYRMWHHHSHGIDILHDIKMLLPRYIPEIIFDVGANVGQSTRQFVSWFPQSQIYCFEPISSTFVELNRNVKSFNNVHCFKLALGNSKGRKNMYGGTCSLLYSINPRANGISRTNSNVESVEIDTLDGFCHRQKIIKISFLKIDTEGHDFEVLRGAKEILSRQMVDIVQVEAGMNPKNQKFVSFEDFKIHLEKRGYFLFGIYEQMLEHFTGKVHLRRTNPVFISERMINIYKRD